MKIFLIMVMSFLCGALPGILTNFDDDKTIKRLRIDSTATHSELEHLKRELRKCNSDSSHKNCLIIKEK